MGKQNIGDLTYLTERFDREKETEEIIEEYEVLLRYLAFQYIRDWSIVDDIMQEVFLKIWLNIDSLKHMHKLKSWLYSTTANQCIDYFRSKYVKTTHLFDSLEELNITFSESVELQVIKNFEYTNLYQIIRTLPIHFKEPIELFYFKDCTYKEISISLGINISTVKNRLFRGRLLLKELIPLNYS